MRTHQCVISVTTVLLQQYVTFNIRRLQLSRRRPEAIKGGINVLRPKTATALLSLMQEACLGIFAFCLRRCCGCTSVFDGRAAVTLPHTHDRLHSQHFHSPPEELSPAAASGCFFHYLPLLVLSARLSASVAQTQLINVSGAPALTPLSSHLALLMRSGALDSSKVPQVKMTFLPAFVHFDG